MKLFFRVNQLEAGAALVDGQPTKTLHLIASAVGPSYRDVVPPAAPAAAAAAEPDDDDEEAHPAAVVPAREIDPDHPHTLQAAAVPSGQVVLNLNDAAALEGMKAGDVITIEIGPAA
jgi:hypothetical protein